MAKRKSAPVSKKLKTDRMITVKKDSASRQYTTPKYTECTCIDKEETAQSPKHLTDSRRIMIKIDKGDLIAVLHKILNAKSTSEVVASKMEASKLIKNIGLSGKGLVNKSI